MRSLIKELKPFNFIMLTVAGIINAVGVNMFLMPVSLYDSGFSGTAMLLSNITPDHFTMPLFLLLLNIPLFVYGCKKQGAAFTVYSVFAVIIYSLSSFFIINVLPVDVSTASPIAGRDIFLCSVFGGIISGIGSGFTIRYGGAIDGVEVMAVIFAKSLGITVGTFVMMYNVILYVIAGIIMSSWQLPLYSIVTYYIGIHTIDFIVEGLDKAKSAIIITKKEQEISSALSEAFGYGVTLINAHGYYSDEPKTVVYFVVNRFQIGKLKSIVHSIDREAFITISEVSDVFGSSIKK